MGWEEMAEKAERVPIDECIPRRLYKLRSRNLILGVYDGKEGFIGVRCKWKDKFLDTEYHWDQGPPHGTVLGVVDTGIDLPDHIQLGESLGIVDRNNELFNWLIAQGGDPAPDK